MTDVISEKSNTWRIVLSNSYLFGDGYAVSIAAFWIIRRIKVKKDV